MRPLNHSDQIVLPSMRSGEVDVSIVPATASEDTWLPFTNSRCMAPSYVAAT